MHNVTACDVLIQTYWTSVLSKTSACCTLANTHLKHILGHHPMSFVATNSTHILWALHVIGSWGQVLRQTCCSFGWKPEIIEISFEKHKNGIYCGSSSDVTSGWQAVWRSIKYRTWLHARDTQHDVTSAVTSGWQAVWRSIKYRTWLHARDTQHDVTSDVTSGWQAVWRSIKYRTLTTCTRYATWCHIRCHKWLASCVTKHQIQDFDYMQEIRNMHKMMISMGDNNFNQLITRLLPALLCSGDLRGSQVANNTLAISQPT